MRDVNREVALPFQQYWKITYINKQYILYKYINKYINKQTNGSRCPVGSKQRSPWACTGLNNIESGQLRSRIHWGFDLPFSIFYHTQHNYTMVIEQHWRLHHEILCTHISFSDHNHSFVDIFVRVSLYLSIFP